MAQLSEVGPSRAGGASALVGTFEEARTHLPLLRWLLVNALALFGFAATWWFGLLQLMIVSDRSYISLVILCVYVAMTAQCFVVTLWISRETDAARRVGEAVRRADGHLAVEGGALRTAHGAPLEACAMSRHIRNILEKARIQGAAGIDQTVLLQALAERLKTRQRLGWFVAGALFKLGLLGTVIGFIMMLAPIGRIDAYDAETMKSALTAMSSGMAVALFTTLAGLVAGMLLGLQYYMLDEAAGRLFARILETTEVYVTPRLGRAE